MYGTRSALAAQAVSDLGCIPIDYQHQNFVQEIHRLTKTGVDVVFDPIGGAHPWASRKALRSPGTVVGYGLTTSLREKDLKSPRPGRRQRFRGTPRFALYIIGGWLLPGRKRVIPYSIQTLKRLKPAGDAGKAHEMLGSGSVIGKIVLVSESRKAEPGLASAAAKLDPSKVEYG
jgi:NADPH2:quinone reductase